MYAACALGGYCTLEAGVYLCFHRLLFNYLFPLSDISLRHHSSIEEPGWNLVNGTIICFLYGAAIIIVQLNN